MIDFWELSGRLLLMEPLTRTKDLYTERLPIQSDGSILYGHSTKAALPFSAPNFYDALRDYFAQRYKGADKLLSPVISMFALGETGVMFFNDKFRNLFEDLSRYLRTAPTMQGRVDTGSDSMFYIALAVITMDKKTRGLVASQGDFLGVEPSALADKVALQKLANEKGFQDQADLTCFTGGWTEGSVDTLRDQNYGANPFRHFRFVTGLT